MSQTPGERRAYQRGYQTGWKRGEPELKRAIEGADRAEARARNAEAGRCGPCQECRWWTRGDPGHVHWGACGLPAHPGLGLTAWRSANGQPITTQENFGCVWWNRSE